MANRLIRYFPDTDLRYGHKGLSMLALANKIDTTCLVDEYVVFTNKKKTDLKMCAPGNVVAHLKMPKGQYINLNVIADLPKYFDGKKINYEAALKKQIEKALNK